MRFRLPFIKLSSTEKSVTLESKSGDPEDIDIRIHSPSEFKLPLGDLKTLTGTPNTPPLTERDIEGVFDTVKVVEEEDEKEGVQKPKEIDCMVSFNGMNRITKINIRGTKEQTEQTCREVFDLDDSVTTRLDVYDPRVEDYVVADSMDHINHCKIKLAKIPYKLRLEASKITTFEEQMGWIEMKVLGSGAFGEVKMVYDRNRGKTLAIKKMHVNKGKEYREKIEKEIQVMQALDHPNIVKCYGYHESGEFIYIVMELMLGGSLKNIMKRIGTGLTEDIIQDYLRQILSALKYIHEDLPTHVYHRDLKCDNFLLSAGAIKLADFGEAKVINRGETFSQTKNNVVGTLTFCSPEMLRGDGAISKRSHAPDIWSLGMVIMEMIYGYNILEKEFKKSITSESSEDSDALYSEYRLIDYILKNLHTLKATTIPNLPVSAELKDLISQCLTENPMDRPKASQLLEHPFFSLTIPKGGMKEKILEQIHFFNDEFEKLQQQALPTYMSTVFNHETSTTTQEYSEDYFD